MATSSPRPGRRGPGRVRRLPVPGLLVALLASLVGSLLAPVPAAAAWPSAQEVVSAMTAAYGTQGTLAVAVARQPDPTGGRSARAAEAATARAAAFRADNGDVAGRPIPGASMVKLYMAADLLHRARTGRLALDREDFALLQAMVRRSDDPAASQLWVRYGGAQMVVDVAERYGLSATSPPAVPGQWGQTLTSARDLARFLSLLPTVAHPADAAAILAWMRLATPIAADGFDQEFGVFGAVPGRPAVKQGWMCCVAGNRHLHSVGVIGRKVVVLLSEVPASVGWDAARAALDAAAAQLPTPRDS
ncbi:MULTISPECIES: serine hydrolase [unclassified Blastococcus]